MFKYKLELELGAEIKNCSECPLCFSEIDFDYDTVSYTCVPDNAKIGFIIGADDYEKEIEKMKRPKDCPLKRVKI